VTALWQFFLLRMLTGIAVGGSFPLMFSLLGDLFPMSRRAAMSALVQIAIGAASEAGWRCRASVRCPARRVNARRSVFPLLGCAGLSAAAIRPQ